MAQLACGFDWPEKFKISKLGSCLRGDAEEFFNGLRDEWWEIEPTLEYAIEEMDKTFSKDFSSARVSDYFQVQKDKRVSWHAHYLYLMAVRNATKATVAMVPESLVLHADPDMRDVLVNRLDESRTDYAAHAQEIARWAQRYEDNKSKFAKPTKMAAAATGQPRVETRMCRICDIVGHIAKDCPKKDGSDDDEKKVRRALSGLVAGELTGADWIVDSGASTHLVREEGMLYDWEECDDPEGVTLPDKSSLRVTRRGKTKLQVHADGESYWVELKNACYAPKLAINLISLGTLMLQGCVLGNKNRRYAVMKGQQVVMYVQIKNNVLVMDQGLQEQKSQGLRDVVMSAIEDSAPDAATVQKGSLMHFHRRFGHLNYDDVERLAADRGNGIELTDRVRENCLTCAEGKQSKTAQPKKDSGLNAPTDVVGGVICSDLKGPISPMDRHKNRYMVNFVDHKSNYVRVFVAKTKDEAAKKFEHFMAFFERQFNVRVHVLRTDGGGEYRNLDLFCERTGIGRQTTERGTSASNGKAERMHRTVMNMVRCMLFGSGLPLTFWGYAAEYAAYVLNRMPTRANTGRKPPLEILTGKPVSVIDVVVFGSPCTVYQQPKNKSTGKRSTPGIIVGKNEETKGYKVLLTKFRVITTTRHVGKIETLTDEANKQLKRVLVAEEEDDLERLALDRQQNHTAEESTGESGQKSKTTKAQKQGKRKKAKAGQTRSSSDDSDSSAAPRRSNRHRTKSKKQQEADDAQGAAKQQPEGSSESSANKKKRAGAPIIATTGTGKTAFTHLLAMSVLGAGEEQFSDLPDPKSYKDSLQMPDAHLWVQARAEEIASLVANKTWQVIKTMKGMHLLRSKWVQKRKKDMQGLIERYKARLVAGGDTQVFGRDYVLTFAAVLDMTSGKVILCVARVWGVRARHFDVPSAYVKAYKEEDIEIYMEIPEGMEFSEAELNEHGVTDASELCLRLVKSLYGLKQAGRLWNRLLHETLIKIGFTQSVTDACVYFKVTSEGTVIVGTYVDDLLATATSDLLLDEFGKDMAVLELKCLGPVENFLGMRISFDESTGYTVDQERTIVELLQKNKLDKANAVRAPIVDESSLESESATAVPLPTKGPGTPEKPTVKSFQSLVGSLLWIARCSRPDIAYAVHRVTRQSHAPTDHDMKIARRVLRYLAGTASVKLVMGGAPTNDGVEVTSHTDADYAADKSTRKSVSGALVLVGGMPVGWQVKQQSAVALSTAETEFVSAAAGAKELLGVKNLLTEVGVPVVSPMRMMVDNQAAIKQIENEATSSSQKHVDVKLKFVRDSSEKGIVKPEYVATQDMLADVLTKSLAAPRMKELREKIGLK